jgi:hypothetical protein
MKVNMDLNWAKEHTPKGCYDPERWDLGCVGCVEQFDAIDEDVPCKRSSPQEQNASPTA